MRLHDLSTCLGTPISIRTPNVKLRIPVKSTDVAPINTKIDIDDKKMTPLHSGRRPGCGGSAAGRLSFAGCCQERQPEQGAQAPHPGENLFRLSLY